MGRECAFLSMAQIPMWILGRLLSGSAIQGSCRRGTCFSAACVLDYHLAGPTDAHPTRCLAIA